MIKEAAAFLGKNLRVARAVARTPAGSSFLRWAKVGAGVGAVYGMADNIIGQDNTSVVQGAVRGAAIGMGLRGLMGGFGGLRPRGGRMGRGTGGWGRPGGLGYNTRALPYRPGPTPRLGGPRISGYLPGQVATMGAGFSMSSGTAGAARARRVAGLLPNYAGMPNWGGQGGVASIMPPYSERFMKPFKRKSGMFGWNKMLRPGD